MPYRQSTVVTRMLSQDKTDSAFSHRQHWTMATLPFPEEEPRVDENTYFPHGPMPAGGQGKGLRWLRLVFLPASWITKSCHHRDGRCRRSGTFEEKKGKYPSSLEPDEWKRQGSPTSLDFILLGRKLGPRKFHPLCRNHLTSERQSSFCISLLLTPILGFFSRRKGTHRLIHTKQPFYLFNKFIKYLLCAVPVWSLAIVLNNKEEPSASLKFTSQLGRQIPDSQFRIQRQVQYSRGD